MVLNNILFRSPIMKWLFRVLFSTFIVIYSYASSYAVQEGRGLPSDTRIKVMPYRSDDVHRYVGYYGYQSSIEFEQNEIIGTITLGDSTGWQLVPNGNRLFLKPIIENADTNMTVITDKRVYHFELYAKSATGVDDPNLTFAIKFLYPTGENGDDIANYSRHVGVDLGRPENYNFNYMVSGNENVTPRRIFDDGEFTYFLFRAPNTDIPAFFTVDDDGGESVVNYRVDGEYIVVEKVAKRFTLRNGREIVCVYNEGYKGNATRVKKHKTLL